MEWVAKEHPGLVPNLEGAELMKADLAGASGIGANLYRVDLKGARLYGANLQGVNLREADLTDAQLGLTIFGNSNLRGTIGLGSCRHLGPSVIDHQTMMKSWPARIELYRLVHHRREVFNQRLRQPAPSEKHHWNRFISYSTGQGGSVLVRSRRP